MNKWSHDLDSSKGCIGYVCFVVVVVVVVVISVVLGALFIKVYFGLKCVLIF